MYLLTVSFMNLIKRLHQLPSVLVFLIHVLYSPVYCFGVNNIGCLQWNCQINRVTLECKYGDCQWCFSSTTLAMKNQFGIKQSWSSLIFIVKSLSQIEMQASNLWKCENWLFVINYFLLVGIIVTLRFRWINIGGWGCVFLG